MKQEDAKDLVIKAQRKLKEVTSDFGSQFASYYRRQIDDLCQEISNSLKVKDDTTLSIATANLREVLYELNREVRLQYEDDEDFLFPNFN